MRYFRLKIAVITCLIGGILFYSDTAFDMRVNSDFGAIIRRTRSLQSADVETLFSSTMDRIEQAFSSLRVRDGNNTGLIRQYAPQLIVIRTQLDALANQARSLYLNGPRTASNIPSSIRESYKEIALRTLQEVYMIATLLNPENMTIGVSGTNFVKKFEYNGEVFTVTIQQNGGNGGQQTSRNFLIERESGGYIMSATDFAQTHNIPWEALIDYVERNLTHAEGSAAGTLARRFSFRIDLDSLQGNSAAVLDITSPYICTMLALFGQTGEYHTRLFGVRSETEFRDKTRELLGIFGI